ncbi:MAG: hypothetical protein JXR76_22555 [Deltaproteobacteria bacterium]|nr:hypothetical protein [Deltaproteobacteria bacterium]
MSKKVVVTATHIKCIDPQDPYLDELYFVTGTNRASFTSKTKRRISKGFDEDVQIELLKTEISDNVITPVLITLWEQRAFKDNGRIAKVIEEAAEKALKYAKRHLTGLSWPELAIKAGAWLLDHAVHFFKRIMKDSPLGFKEIVLPRVAGPGEAYDYPNSIEGETQYHFTAKGDKESFYHYEIDLMVKIS